MSNTDIPSEVLSERFTLMNLPTFLEPTFHKSVNNQETVVRCRYEHGLPDCFCTNYKKASIEGTSLDIAVLIDLPQFRLLLRLVFRSSN